MNELPVIGYPFFCEAYLVIEIYIEEMLRKYFKKFKTRALSREATKCKW